MSVVLIPAGASVVEEVARILEGSGSEPADALVVFPGKRPAHFLRRRLAQVRGAGFRPPRILSMDDLVGTIADSRNARAGKVQPGLDSIDAVAILYDIQLAAPHPLGGTGFMTLDSFFPLGMKLWADLEELMIECVPLPSVAGVQALVQESIPAASRERLQTLAHFYEEFYRVVEARGFSTRASRYRRASDDLVPADIDCAGPVVLAGFSRLSASERTLFACLAAWPRVSMVFQEGPGLRQWIRDIPGALPVPQTPRETTAPRPAVCFTSSSDAHGQVFALAAALGKPDMSTVIVLPRAETLFPLLRHALSRLNPDDYNVSLPYPLQRTPLYGFFDSLMELVSSMEGEMVYLPAYVSFVLHPYVKNIRMGASAEATRVLFHAVEDRLTESPTRKFGLLQELESDQELFRDAALRLGETDPAAAARLQEHLRDIHQRTVGSFRSFRNVRDFAERCVGLISWVHDRSTARDHPFFTPFFDQFSSRLETIAGSLMAEKSFNDAASYFALLRRFLNIMYLPFPGTPLQGLQVLGVLETRNLSFQRVFVLDANEGVFPDTGTDSTLLPFAVRMALGLPTSRDTEDMAAYHFAQTVAGARELHLLYLESGEKERSRFVERLLWEQEKSEAVGGGATVAAAGPRSVQYQVNLTSGPPPAVEKTAEVSTFLRARQTSATALSTYLQCPLKFYYREVLGLSEREEPGSEVDASQIGMFVHRVLQRFFSPLVDRRLGAEDADPRAMERVVDGLFPDWFGPAESGAGRLLHDQVRRHLGDFVTGYLAPLARSRRLVIRGLERTVDATWEGFLLRGRFDAIYEIDGRPVLVDYKTSANASSYAIRWKKLDVEDRSSWSAAIPTLQLPVYALLQSTQEEGDPAGAQAMFLLLGRTVMDRHIELALYSEERPGREAWPLLETVIRRLLQEIVSPDVPFTPARDLKTACAWCDFTGICGTGWLRAK